MFSIKQINQKESPDKSSTSLLHVELAQVHRQTKFTWTIPVSWLNNILAQCEYPVWGISGQCDVTFTSETQGLHLQGMVHFVGETECATCLSKLKLDLCAHIDTFMQPADSAEDTQDELTPEDLNVEYYQGTTLILDDMVTDSILLELPMHPRCERACKKINGLVTVEELEQRESTVDPRLQALANIKLSKES
ncbi:MAG: DUF177 domain-containing protein [Deltaproteobacteria bacterium]|nr:DUF177 domain-containing protein [Deltaproteobacteria bacterium]